MNAKQILERAHSLISTGKGYSLRSAMRSACSDVPEYGTDVPIQEAERIFECAAPEHALEILTRAMERVS